MYTRVQFNTRILITDILLLDTVNITSVREQPELLRVHGHLHSCDVSNLKLVTGLL